MEIELEETVLDSRSGSSNQKINLEKEDVTSKVVGDFGRWQLQISFLMSLLKLSNAWYQLNIIFMAPTQDFWCAKPTEFDDISDNEWRDICAPKIEEFPCLIYDPALLAAARDMDKSMIPLVACTNFVYDTSLFQRTMTSDWGLVCNRRWLIHLTQFVMMTGVLLGGILFGRLADKCGRKTPLMVAILIQSCTSYVASVLPWYWYFLANWFILALASGGITIISFVLCMETVSGKWRMTVPVLYQLPFGLGNTVMAFLAYWLRDWRKLEFGLATCSSLYILYWFCIPESPRWLIANGQINQAAEVLKKAAAKNNRYWSTDQIKRLIPTTRTDNKKPPGFSKFLKSRNMRLTTILLSINWLFTGIAFYTFVQFLGDIGGNIFITVALTGIVSTPGPIICVLIITRVGRRTTLWIFQFFTGLCFIALLLIPRDLCPQDWPRLLFAGIGFASMAASVPTLYLYTGELYPTLGRNVGVGGVTTFARIGSMIAPFVLSLDSTVVNFPLMFIATTTFAQMFLLYPLPETKGKPLPDTLEEAEQIFKKSASAKVRKSKKRPSRS
ncbi:organic cation transporter protein-like isoform X2 [Hyposmocoma kahamanoa]|uniref:organic cation transporter protein-like isoform X2 n=1 Tax=Hyposmocoma kahamanoa TaxID=1477025 RepID=UPI000E6D77DC|nr:organic cation transporter protein-like isoform X2 [Hyposmocoma kahamanoa]